jgi:hypothetical protein
MQLRRCEIQKWTLILGQPFCHHNTLSVGLQPGCFLIAFSSLSGGFEVAGLKGLEKTPLAFILRPQRPRDCYSDIPAVALLE